MAKNIVESLFVILILVISITLLHVYPLAFAYATEVNSTSPSTTIPSPTHPYPPCPANYTPANFPCTVTVGNYVKVIGAPRSAPSQSSATTPTITEFGSLASMIIVISIIGMMIISRKFSSYRIC